MCKIIATSMEERSKRLQHLLKRNEEMQVLNNSRINKTRSLPTEAAELFSSYSSSIIKRDQLQTDTSNRSKLDGRRRSLSTGKIVPNPTTLTLCRRFSSAIDNISLPQVHNRFASSELPTSCSNLNFMGLHRMSRDGSDADVESLCSTTDTKYLLPTRISTASIDSNSFNRAQTASPTNQLQSTRHSLQMSDNDRCLSDDGGASNFVTNGAYRKKRFSLTSLHYYNTIEPGKHLFN